jgi:16S rRNA (cytidine1402-2'-O)-methyltransferase
MTEDINKIQEAGKLFIVATPIGNLEDITFRAIRTLKEVDIIACEDTRVTRKLLNHYSIEGQTISLHHHSGSGQYEKIISFLKEGKNVAYCSDAGTPGVSDPGNRLVAEVAKEDILVVPIPGASALATIVSVSGIDMQQFSFLGFPPHKKGRETFFKKIIKTEEPVIYYDSPHRVIKNLELLESLLESENTISKEKQFDKKIIIGRELTKMFEQIVRGDCDEVVAYFKDHPDKLKGEFAVIVY